MKKLFFPLLILSCINATISCKKEITANNKVLNAVSSDISKDTVATGNTGFGVWVCTSGTSDSKLVVANILGVSYVRTSVILTEYNGKIDLMDKANKSGVKVLLNLNYAQVNGSANPFPKDMVKYRQLLGTVLSKYKPEVAVIENEPTTEKMHSGPIEDYIAMLAVAVDVCHQYGVKVADGATHPENVQLVMNGRASSGNALKVKKLIAAYTTLNLDYVNIHAQGTGTIYPAGKLTSVADYLRATTGKQVMSNESHLETNSTTLMKSMVDQWKAGNYKYAIVITGAKAMPLINGTKLTAIGTTYRNEIN